MNKTRKHSLEEKEEPPIKKIRQTTEKENTFFIALHFGAGKHSAKHKNEYKKLGELACSEALKLLKKGEPAGCAVVLATKILEDSGLLNAGKGSNLTIEKTVECDAGYMDSDGYFGGVGAVPEVPNPILIAENIANTQKNSSLLPLGRVPPNFLVGEGAKSWAMKHNIPVCSNEDLICRQSLKTFNRYTKKLIPLENHGVNDTVGAIALDVHGNVAATCSSGGNLLKYSGRVGHAPIYGCGCWAAKSSASACASALAEPVSIAVSTSGPGEILTKLHFSKSCYDAITSQNCDDVVKELTEFVKSSVLDNQVSKLIQHHKEDRIVGTILLTWNGKHGEFSWCHTSPNFVVFYAGSRIKGVKMIFSESEVFNSAGPKVGAISFS